MRYFFRYFAILLCFCACQTKDGSSQTNQPARDSTITPNNAFAGIFFDSTELENYLSTLKVPDTVKSVFRSFYGGRNFQYAWFDNQGLAEQAPNFWNLQENYLATSADSSLYNPFLQTWIDSARNNGPAVVPDSLRLKVEWGLTFQFLRYASRAYRGNRKLNTRNLEWFIPRRKVALLSMLDTLIKDQGKNISEYEPVNQQYGMLRSQLERYEKIRNMGGWHVLSPKQQKYSAGDSLEDIRLIKERLFLTGDLKTRDTSWLFDERLTLAVKNFQKRYGLKEDGILGGGTLKEMNQPIEARIRQILVNMERIRWIPDDPKGDFLLVNIPAFRLYVYEDAKPAFDMNVVVGTSQNNTVIFTGKIQHVVFSPYWNVPPGILNKEVLPGIRRNKSYLARHNMEWNGGNVRQKPGPKNSLGLVKFLFPNSYNIYLHDTPSKSLFNEDKRAFSHGCIRVAEPKKLAQWILKNESAWTSTAIDKAMHAGKEKYVSVKRNIPVFIGYFTAWVDSAGQLNFRDDLYGHDKKMAEKMFGK